MTASSPSDRSPESGSARRGKPYAFAHAAISRASSKLSQVPSPASTSTRRPQIRAFAWSHTVAERRLTAATSPLQYPPPPPSHPRHQAAAPGREDLGRGKVGLQRLVEGEVRVHGLAMREHAREATASPSRGETPPGSAPRTSSRAAWRTKATARGESSARGIWMKRRTWSL